MMSAPQPRLLEPTLGLLAWSLLVTAAGGQPPEQPAGGGFGERVDVEIVNVDVWVTDARGEPVTGLDAADFEVLHDDRPVSIAHFTEVRSGVAAAAPRPSEETTAPGGASAPDAAFPGYLVVYFDRSRIHPARYPALVRALEELLEGATIDSERVLLLRQDRGLAVEAPFGSSRKELRQALGRLAQGTPSGLELETETRLALEAIRDTWEESDDLAASVAGGLAGIPATPGVGQGPGGAGGGGAGAGGPRAIVGGAGVGSGPDACGSFVGRVRPILDAWARAESQRVAVTLSHLSSTAGFLAGLPGAKALVYLSDGLETRPGADLASYAASLCPGAGSDLMTGGLVAEMTSGFRDLTRHANTNRVTLYALQTSGLRASETGDAASGRTVRGGAPRARGSYETSKRAGDREGLRLLAEETGGRAIFDRNELGPELERIGREIRHYYSLAYELPPGGAGEERRSHRIEVKMRDPGLTARYRRGYLEKSPDEWLTERVEGALNLGITRNPLGVRLGAGAVEEPEPGRFRLPLHVMVPVERLAFAAQEGSSVAQVTLKVLARAIDGDDLVAEDRVFRLKGAPGATGLADLGVPLELGAGVHVIAVGVQDASTREASFVSTTLEVGPEG